MTFSSYDWTLSAFYIIALVMLLRVRRSIKIDGQAVGFGQMVTGLSILAMTEVGRIYYVNGLLSNISFLAEPLFFSLIAWICVISGASLLASGVSHWLPVVRSYRQTNESKIRRLEYIRRVEQLIGFEGRIDTICRTVLDFMVDQFDLRAGAILTYHSQSDTLHIVSATAESGIDQSTVFRLHFNRSGWKRYLDGAPARSAGIIAGLDSISGNPQYLLPIQLGDRLFGLFLLWTEPDREADHNDELLLKTGVDIVVRKIEYETIKEKRHHRSRAGYQTTILHEALRSVSTTRERLMAVARYSQDVLHAPVTALTVYDEVTHQGYRLAMGESGAVLEQRLSDRPWEMHICDDDRTTANPLVISAAEETTAAPDTEYLPYPSGSIAAIRHTTESTIVILTFHTPVSNSLSPASLHACTVLDLLLRMIAADENARNRQNTAERQFGRLQSLAGYLAARPAFLDAARFSARLLNDELQAEMVRISVVDRQARFLESRALEVNTLPDRMIPERGTLILSLLPLHREVIQTAKPALIDDLSRCTRFDQVERQQAFIPNLSSLMIVPVILGGQVRGIIDVALSKSSPRHPLNKQDLRFTEFVADLLSISALLHASHISTSRFDRTSPISHMTHADSGTGYHRTREIQESVSGILDSVELLRGGEQSEGDHTNRLLSIIDRSARKLDSWLHEQADQQSVITP